MAQGRAGVGVATVGDDAPAHPILQISHGHVDGGGLHPVQGVDSGGGALPLRQDHGQVVFVRAASRFYATVNAGGSKALGGTYAARYLFQHDRNSFSVWPFSLKRKRPKKKLLAAKPRFAFPFIDSSPWSLQSPASGSYSAPPRRRRLCPGYPDGR